MSNEVATILAMALYALAFVPLVVNHWAPGKAAVLGVSIAAAAAATAFAQTGILQRDELANSNVAQLMPTDVSGSRCQKLLELLEEADVLLGEPNAGTLTVRGSLWDQIPETVRTATSECIALQAGGAKVRIDRR
jgi:hypothetical protein